MPPAKKRKIADESKVKNGEPVDETAVPKSQVQHHDGKDPGAEPSGDPQPDVRSVDKTQERKERFKALQARAVSLLRSTISEWPSTDPYVAKVLPEEPQRSSRRVTTTSDRPQSFVLTFSEAGIRITQPT